MAEKFSHMETGLVSICTFRNWTSHLEPLLPSPLVIAINPTCAGLPPPPPAMAEIIAFHLSNPCSLLFPSPPSSSYSSMERHTEWLNNRSCFLLMEKERHRKTSKTSFLKIVKGVKIQLYLFVIFVFCPNIFVKL